MKVDIRDRETFQSIPPLEVLRYLRAQGWEEKDQHGDLASIWGLKLTSGQELEVLLPLQQTLGDYGLRMSEAFRVLEEAEERSQLDILQDILSVGADIIRVRLRAGSRESHSLPIEDAVLATQKAREMMLAAACAAVEPREYYHARKFEQATDYVRRLRMAPTQPGSFVFIIHSRVPPAFKQQELSFVENGQDDQNAPFERQVTYTLATGLAAAHLAAQRATATGEITPFEEAVQAGVSANLCDALLGFAGTDASSPFEIRLSYSSTRRAPRRMPRQILFSPDTLPIFEEVSRVFKAQSPRDEFELEGVVVRLEQEEVQDSRALHIAGPVDGRLRKVALTLPEEDFQQAIEAFSARSTVRVTGKLIRTGNRYQLRAPRNFEVLPGDD